MCTSLLEEVLFIKKLNTLKKEYGHPPHDAVLAANVLLPLKVAFDSDINIAAPRDP